jgi:hypothetical protein
MDTIQEGGQRLEQFRTKSRDRINNELENLIEKLEEALLVNSMNCGSMYKILKAAKDMSERASETINTNHNHYHRYLLKLLKLIDKQTNSAGSSSDRRLPFFPRATYLQELPGADPYLIFIVRHFAWYGFKTAAEAISLPSPTPLPNRSLADDVLSYAERHHMNTMAPVIENIRKENYQPLIEWLYLHEKIIGSITAKRIRFEIAVADYLANVETKEAGTALKFAQKRFAEFHSDFNVEIGKLMSLLLWRVPPRRYSQLTLANQKELLCILVLRCSAQMHNLPPFESNLQTLVDVGLFVVEEELFSKSDKSVDLGVYQTENGIAINAEAGCDVDTVEIPVEMSVPSDFKYHSSFSCPVTWQRASFDNSPVLLACGHAILEKTSEQLPRHSGDRLYCPTCYRECRGKDLIKMII